METETAADNDHATAGTADTPAADQPAEEPQGEEVRPAGEVIDRLLRLQEQAEREASIGGKRTGREPAAAGDENDWGSEREKAPLPCPGEGHHA